MGQLQLDPLLIDRARKSAKAIAATVHRQASRFTTTAIERATLRLLGVDGVDGQGIPLPNVVVDHYCSGLCMPEIAVMGALERLDMMLNDCMYGIIFRDINMQRTFIDQFFSRMVNAYAGITINTGEDNYLTTADAYTQPHTVLASQFINEQFALLSGLAAELIGLGHACEINPEMEDGFLWELAQAQLVRQVFPNAPVKYMPPTKYMTGNIFHGHVQDALFNIASLITGQTIHLLGILTEAVHNPFLQDRFLSIANARYIFNNMRHLGEEIEFKPGGRLLRRASHVLSQAADMLDEVKSLGLMEAISRGMFADISRSPGGGKGLDGVIAKSEEYYNPFPGLMIGRAWAHGVVLRNYEGVITKYTEPDYPQKDCQCEYCRDLRGKVEEGPARLMHQGDVSLEPTGLNRLRRRKPEGNGANGSTT